MNLKPSHLFLLGLGVVGAYVGYKEYKLYERRKLIRAGLDPSKVTAPREVFNEIAAHNPATGTVVTKIPESAGLEPCATAFPGTPFLWDVFRSAKRCA